jgi:hypothetical protein
MAADIGDISALRQQLVRLAQLAHHLLGRVPASLHDDHLLALHRAIVTLTTDGPDLGSHVNVIYLQAKRWAEDHAVRRPDVQAFSGALQGVHADKGVFITTSRFTEDARSYAAGIQTRIVLIDGAELAELMIDHGVGVSVARSYELKRLDEDYFDSDLAEA